MGLALGACESSESQKTDGDQVTTPESPPAKEEPVMEKPAKLTGTMADLAFMIGKWRQQEANGAYSDEVWHKEGPDRLTGAAFTIMGGDTVWSEKLEMRVEDGEVVYVADVPENDAPVKFKMTEISLNSATFENPTNEFPWKIVYTLSGDSLHARIAGFKNGQAAANDLYMIRVK